MPVCFLVKLMLFDGAKQVTRFFCADWKRTFLADGGHDELSPMYHQIMLDMYQEVADVMTSKK